MSFSDFLRRLSYTLLGWPKIDDSPLVLPEENAAVLVECDKATTPLSTFLPLILLILMQEDDSMPGNKVIQDIGGTYESIFTAQDMKLAKTDYGMNFLWTQSVRVAAKSLIHRGLIVIGSRDKWQITPSGRDCGRRIHAGNNTAWQLYDSLESEITPPEPAQITISHEESKVPFVFPTIGTIKTVCDTETTPNPIEAIRCYNELNDGVVRGMKLLRKDGSEIRVPIPDFPPIGRTEDGRAYHRSSEVNVLALWFVLDEYHNTVPTELSARVSNWYEGKHTELDNEDVGNFRTRFKRHTANLLHDLKRQKLIARDDFFDTWHVTEKGFQSIVDALKEQGVPK